ncbi:hypothetical protein OESDEN_21222, partial [Oesophagostomum dentatum]
EIPCSPPGFASLANKADAVADPRKPLSCLNGNSPSFSPYLHHQFQEQSPASSYLMSPLSRLRLDDGAEMDTSFAESRSRALLPSWVMDGQGRIIAPLSRILEADLLPVFARDKSGCTFLQANYPAEGTPEREAIGKQLLENGELFEVCSIFCF